jgi:tetratricopeptide (TPR) repeat protein
MFSWVKGIFPFLIKGLLGAQFKQVAALPVEKAVCEPLNDKTAPESLSLPAGKGGAEHVDDVQELLKKPVADILSYTNILVKEKKFSEAIDVLEYCVDNGRDESEILFALAISYDLPKDAAKAAEYVVEALKKEPENLKFQMFYADVLPLVQVDYLTQAIIVYEHLLEKNTSDPYVYFRYAKFMFERMDCPGMAQEYLDHARNLLKPGVILTWQPEMADLYDEISNQIEINKKTLDDNTKKRPEKHKKEITGRDPGTGRPLDDIWRDRSPS